MAAGMLGVSAAVYRADLKPTAQTSLSCSSKGLELRPSAPADPRPAFEAHIHTSQLQFHLLMLQLKRADEDASGHYEVTQSFNLLMKMKLSGNKCDKLSHVSFKAQIIQIPGFCVSQFSLMSQTSY